MEKQKLITHLGRQQRFTVDQKVRISIGEKSIGDKTLTVDQYGKRQ